MSQGTALVRRESIEELCGHRARALKLYGAAADLLLEARKAHMRALPGVSHANYVSLDSLRYLDIESHRAGTVGDRFMAEAQKVIDPDMWRALVDFTGLGGLMDTEEREKLESQLRDRKQPVPEITPDTVEATLLRLLGDAPTIFRRGLVRIWERLSKAYKSHDGFKIGARMVLTPYHWQGHKAPVIDIDRVMHILDGKPFPKEYNAGLAGAIRTAQQAGQDECETPYFRARWFSNGNLHLWMLRDDLVAQANKLIAEERGTNLGARPEARHHFHR